MRIVVNGERIVLEQPVSIAELLRRHALHGRMVVVEQNGEIVPRDRYEETQIADGDTLEIVQMMAGG